MVSYVWKGDEVMGWIEKTQAAKTYKILKGSITNKAEDRKDKAEKKSAKSA